MFFKKNEGFPSFFYILKQTGDFTVFVYIDFLSSGNFRKPGHGENITGKNYDETCACGRVLPAGSYETDYEQ